MQHHRVRLTFAGEPAAAGQTAPVAGAWRELCERKRDFQDIMRLLIDYDERTGRFERYDGSELHYLRKTIALCREADLRIYLRSLGAFVYCVVGELRTAGARVATAWVHEDGIRAEREVWTDPEHPVHGITCLTDLFQAASRALNLDLEAGGPGDCALELMLDESLYDE